jgi:hypothetical protein
MMKQNTYQFRLRFGLPVSVLSWSLTMWIFGPKLLIHSDFIHILALLSTVLSWVIIPFAVVCGTFMKENMRKQDIILKAMYVAAAFSTLYSAVETAIDHFI